MITNAEVWAGFQGLQMLLVRELPIKLLLDLRLTSKRLEPLAMAIRETRLDIDVRLGIGSAEHQAAVEEMSADVFAGEWEQARPVLAVGDIPGDTLLSGPQLGALENLGIVGERTDTQ